ncbi:MAG: (d)CMP kinase [Pseudomonadota bacterium]
MNVPVLTIDGPSGAGKGTVSRIIAKRLGWHYLDSGAMYRSLAIAALNRDQPLDDPSRIALVAEEMALEFQCNDTLVVMLDGVDITGRIPTEACGKAASVIAAYPAVRAGLLEKQRAFKRSPGLVADGRDMGTVVFPDAEFKIFLTASLSARAERRYKQLIEKGLDVNLEKIIEEVAERDRCDSERATAPLVKAEDALLIDSSSMTIEEVIERGLAFVRHRA